MGIEVAQMEAVDRLGVAIKRIAVKDAVLLEIAEIAETSKMVESLTYIGNLARIALGHRFAAGCCSASSPCSHQKEDPTTICETCRKAWAEEARRRASVTG